MEKKLALPPDIALQVAFAALGNARRLHAAAESLVAGNHFGPAVALAVSAREETGKFVRALFVALELRPGEGATASLRGHQEKQAIGAAMSSLPAVLEQIRTAFASGSALKGESVEELIDTITQRVRLAADAIEWPSDTASIGAAVDSAASGDDERRRRRGLYVDPVSTDAGWSISDPASITESEARREVAFTGTFLSLLAKWEEALSFDPSVEALPVPDQETLRLRLAAFASEEAQLAKARDAGTNEPS